MGMFTSVFKERKCLRCRGKYLAEYQIKTGKDCCAQYRDGDLVGDYEFDGCKGSHRACYSPLCHVCEMFMFRETEELKKGARDVVIHSGCEIRETGSAIYIFKGDRRIGEFFHGTLTTVDRSRDFRKIEDAVVERWTRQIRSAGMDGYVQIFREWENRFFFGDNGKKKEYRLQLTGPFHCTSAEVKIGKRFTVRVVEPNTLDPFKYLEACSKYGIDGLRGKS